MKSFEIKLIISYNERTGDTDCNCVTVLNKREQDIVTQALTEFVKDC